MSNPVLLKKLENILGTSSSSTQENYMFFCPSCHHHKRKLSINLSTGQFKCWVCGNTKDGLKGRKISSLLKRIKVNQSIINQIKPLLKEDGIQEQTIVVEEKIELPNEFIPLTNRDKKNIIAKHAIAYLKSRNITENDIIKYNIGYCEEGKYKNMIIIPSYDSNMILNYYSSRTFDPEAYIKFGKPKHSSNFIGLEYLVNFNLPVILCEGIFDAIAIKRNVIPLYGKDISPVLRKKLISSDVIKIYIALDKDAIQQSLTYAEEFMNYGKEIYLVELEKKDPSEMGFKEFTELIQTTKKLTQSSLMKLKINSK
jgi:hypothetical protein